MKQTIILNESQFNRLVKETVKRVLFEGRGVLGNYLDNVIEVFNDAYLDNKETIDKHIDSVKKSGNFKDFETRLSWDLASALHYWEWDFLPKDEQGFIAGNDNTLTTLFKEALRRSNINF